MFKETVTETFRSEISKFDLFTQNQNQLIKEFKKKIGKEDFLKKVFLQKMPYQIKKNTKEIRVLDSDIKEPINLYHDIS